LTPAAVHHQAQEMVDQVAIILNGEIPPGAVNAAEAERLKGLAH
jgi:D-3-phosphoglycerate dehydrogenase